jgi:hypothetical protein
MEPNSSPELTDPTAEPIPLRVIEEGLEVTNPIVIPEEPVAPDTTATEFTKYRSVELSIQYDSTQPIDKVLENAYTIYAYITAPTE